MMRAVSAIRELVFPQRVIVGEGAAAALGDQLGDPGLGPLLLVCDQVLSATGAIAPIVASLRARGREVDVFDAVRAEPTVALADEVRARVRGRGVTQVVGVGGGSAMDLAKVAAALCADPDVPLAELATGRPLAACAALALVPTTAGTGAEATVIAMLFGDAGKVILKTPSFVPQLAVLDPLLVRSLPPGPTAATGLDALSHALEAHMSLNASPISDAAGRAAAVMIAGSLERAFADGGDLAARSDMLVAAHLAGQALNAGVVVGHSIAYVLAEEAHLSHGVSCAMALPFCLLYNAQASGARLDALAPLLTGDAAAGRHDLIRWVWALSRRLGIPATLGEVGMPAGRAAEHAARLVAAYPRPTNPCPLDVASLERLFALMERADIEAAIAGWRD